jgi:hypothetical protein
MQRRFLLTLIATLSLGACREATREAGTYKLESINARALPTQFSGVEVISGSLTLRPDETYTTQTTIRAKDSLGQIVTQTQSESGTYVRTDSSLRFSRTNGVETTATYGGGTITIREASNVIAYRRQ